MKKHFLLSFFVIVSIFVLLLLFSCSSTQKINYYSKTENYIKVTGTISSIEYNEDRTTLYLEFSELKPILNDTCFKIVGGNLQVVQNNGIDDKIQIGDKITFVTAPKYFGDGYVMPIVSISTADDEWLLEFEEGYKNLLKWLQE